jgi:hypothetical protein
MHDFIRCNETNINDNREAKKREFTQEGKPVAKLVGLG